MVCKCDQKIIKYYKKIIKFVIVAKKIIKYYKKIIRKL